jgi:hypothetical protein
MSVFYDNTTDEVDSAKTHRYKKERVIYIDDPPIDSDDTSPNTGRIGDNFTMETHGEIDEQKEDVRISGECEQYVSDKRQKTSGA